MAGSPAFVFGEVERGMKMRGGERGQMKMPIGMSIVLASVGIGVGLVAAEEVQRPTRLVRPSSVVGTGTSSSRITAGATAVTVPGRQALAGQVEAIRVTAPHNRGVLQGAGGMVSGVAPGRIQRPAAPEAGRIAKPPVPMTGRIARPNLERQSR